jgi:hypothetical protein
MYIPKGKLDPKVYYTPGGTLFLSTNQLEYVGYYHKDTYGNSWTGKEHTIDSIQLIGLSPSNQINSNINTQSIVSSEYSNIAIRTGGMISSTSIPIQTALPPTEEDYNQTYFTRYILKYKLSSSPIFIEVNKSTYFQTISSQDGEYFDNIEVLWKISGPFYDEKENNILIRGGIYNSNLRSIELSEQKIPGISNYLNNLLLYTRPD